MLISPSLTSSNRFQSDSVVDTQEKFTGSSMTHSIFKPHQRFFWENQSAADRNRRKRRRMLGMQKALAAVAAVGFYNYPNSDSAGESSVSLFVEEGVNAEMLNQQPYHLPRQMVQYPYHPPPQIPSSSQTPYIKQYPTAVEPFPPSGQPPLMQQPRNPHLHIRTYVKGIHLESLKPGEPGQRRLQVPMEVQVKLSDGQGRYQQFTVPKKIPLSLSFISDDVKRQILNSYAPALQQNTTPSPGMRTPLETIPPVSDAKLETEEPNHIPSKILSPVAKKPVEMPVDAKPESLKSEQKCASLPFDKKPVIRSPPGSIGQPPSPGIQTATPQFPIPIPIPIPFLVIRRPLQQLLPRPQQPMIVNVQDQRQEEEIPILPITVAAAGAAAAIVFGAVATYSGSKSESNEEVETVRSPCEDIQEYNYEENVPIRELKFQVPVYD